MKNNKLRIGRIPYANLFPIFYYLDKQCDCSAYRFFRGVPSALNTMLRKGKLDISPSSSVEYLRHKKHYQILPRLSISSSGPISSILLFSKFPLTELGGKTIAVSSDSETSVVLLKIILKEFFSLKCRFRALKSKSVDNALSSYSAVLLIGDEAMKEAKRQSTVNSQQSNPPLPPFTKGGHRGINHSSRYIYDLGELWFKHTGKPFVFALWIARKSSLLQKKDLIRKLSSDLIKAREYASGKFSFIARQAPQKKWTSERELVQYWKCISYDFTDRHLEGLRLFERYMRKISGA